MNRSYLRVRLGTSISPYRGSTCYKFYPHSKTLPYIISTGPQHYYIEKKSIEKGTKRVYLPLQYSGMYHGSIYSFYKKKKRKSSASQK